MQPVGRLEHDALFFGSEEEFVDHLVPFLRDGIRNGDGTAVASTRAHIEILRRALGNDSLEIEFLTNTGCYLRPTWTITCWQRVLERAAARGHGFTRIVGEVFFGTRAEHQTWTRYEAAINEVFAAAPAWIVCPYDRRLLPAAVLEDAARTHPTVCAGSRHGSATYVPPAALLAELPEPLPAAVGDPVLDVPFTDVAALRARVRAAAGRVLPPDRREDLLIAVSETATNAMTHGRGERRLRLWAEPGRVVGEVHDEGLGPDDPLAGYRPPAPDVDRGRGLWVAGNVCDALAIRTDAGGTTVRFAIGGGRVVC